MIFIVFNTANENRKQTYCWGLSTAEQRNGHKIRTSILAFELFTVASYSIPLFERCSKINTEKLNQIKLNERREQGLHSSLHRTNELHTIEIMSFIQYLNICHITSHRNIYLLLLDT